MSAAKKLRTLLAGNRALIAPAVFNPLSAKLAEAAGFEVLYLGGGTIGYLNGCLEANLNITQLCQVGIEIRAASNLPLILDGAAGFGDPMHMHHTITMAEAAGFAAIEIEDQMLYLSVRNAEDARTIARELPSPFMFGLPGHGDKGAGLALDELGALGYRILASSISAWAFHRAMKQSYECLARGVPDPAMAGTTHKDEQHALHHSIDMDRMLAVEKATVEK